MHTDHERCYRAAESRDARFDGVFFVGVKTTGIYCRPSCPAVTPKRQNVTFHATAAAAQDAGFRACRRCRPDTTPGSPEWNVRADAVGQAMRLIGDGVVEREGVEGLASRLGYSQRHVTRMLTQELGAGPLAFVRLVAPTTPVDRMREIARHGRGFVYLISRLGVTGMQADVASDLPDSIARLRTATDLPICVGFGVSTGAQAQAIGRLAGGIVVGSAIVQAAERGIDAAHALTVELRQALDNI